MWPQLLALIPHITRLVPAVDRYLQSRSASDRAHQEALTSMSNALQNELTQINEAGVSLNTQLQNQAIQLAAVAEDLRRTRASFESAQIRADATELQLTRLTTILRNTSIAFGILLLVLTILITVLLHANHPR